MNYKPMYLAIAVALMTCMMQVSEAKSAKENFGPDKLATAYLTYESLKDIGRWWNDEISGQEFAKKISKNVAGKIGSTAGEHVGAAIFNYFYPEIGTSIIAKFVGGIVGMQTTHYLIDSLPFDSPKDVVLKEAYKFLELKENASISEINQSFYRLSNKYKLGTDNFEKLQHCIQIIKMSKGEIF